MYASLRVTALTVTATFLSILVLLTWWFSRPRRLWVSGRTTGELPNSQHRPAHALAGGHSDGRAHSRRTLLDAEPSANGTLGGRSLAARLGARPPKGGEPSKISTPTTPTCRQTNAPAKGSGALELLDAAN